MRLPTLKTLVPFATLVVLAACTDDVAQPPPAQTPEPPVTGTPPPPQEPTNPVVRGVPIIYDTDFGLDVDDVGALAMIHKLADEGEATLLGVVSNVSDPYAPAAIDVINTYYGRPDIPIGLAEGGFYAEAYPYWRDPAPRYIKDLAEDFPHDTSTNPADIPTAVATYRKLLASQPDGSVTVVSVGFMQNLSGLMASGPDAYSTLGGVALIRRKVKELVIMGGEYPGSTNDLYLTGGREMNPSYAVDVLEDWPGKTVFNTGKVCESIVNGQTLADRTPPSNPVRAAYTMFFEKEGEGRNSWDLCSVLYTVRGTSGPEGTYFATHTDEHLTLNEAGVSRWVGPGNGRHVRLTLVMDEGVMQALFEDFMTTPPENE